jgi:hypothetical protein
MDKAIQLKAGAACIHITPEKPSFLWGYPYVKRISTGVHDHLQSTALYITNGIEEILFISNDILYIGKESVCRIRDSVSDKIGIPASHILIAATHTHSGPVTVDCLISANDPVVPKTDPEYLYYMEKQTVYAACKAYREAIPVKAGLIVADITGIGTNRHNPIGASHRSTPVLVLNSTTGKPVACMLICSMHPTVLHEDSTLYSADFPAYTKKILQQEYFKADIPILWFTGPAGNQSPRHVTQANTFEEAERLGRIAAKAIGEKIATDMGGYAHLKLSCCQDLVDLPKRNFPDEAWAISNRDKARHHFYELREKSNDPKEIRTAEVDWFGSEELLFLTKLAASDEMRKAYQSCLPAEIQIINIGKWSLVAWPGEIFVEYALQLKKKFADAFLISLANGELQGYLVTEEAEKLHYYEASNSLFHFSGGDVLLQHTYDLLSKMKQLF